MSTPTINTAATQGLAKVVTSLEHQVTAPTYTGPPSLNEVIQLAETMTLFADDSIRSAIDRLWAASDAIDAAEEQISSGRMDTENLLDVDPEALTQRVLASCRDRAARETLAYQNAQYFRDALARTAGASLRSAGDSVVTSLRKDFDKHVKVVITAAQAGITEHTEPDALLASGTAQQIAAYRALPAAVAGLEQIASLRNQMTALLHYGPPAHPVLSFVTGLATALDLDGAANQYDGETEVMQYNQEFVGSTLVNVRTQRLGGRWLALAHSPALTLHLNTAAEVQAQHDGLTR